MAVVRIPPFHAETQADNDRATARVSAALGSLQDCELLRGRNVAGVALVVGVARQVRHGLGRRPLGYFVTGQSAAGVLRDTARDEWTLTLVSTATGSFSLWVF